MTGVDDIPIRRLRWTPCYRIIPSRFPPIDIFERVADPADLDAVLEVEALTNERLRAEAGDLALVPPGERVTGPGASYIMAAFTHPTLVGNRFSDGSFGVYYAAREEATSIAESRHHREAFMRATAQPRMELDMRVLVADVDGSVHDIRGMRDRLPDVYSDSDYSASQRFARTLRETGTGGIAYDSLRREGGQCLAAFRPRILKRCRQARHLSYHWDGARITHVFEKRLRKG